MCQAEVAESQLVRNIQLDRLIALAVKEKEKASLLAFSTLSRADAAAPAQSGAPTLKPLEAIFHKHMRKCMVAYDERYQSLLAAREAEYAHAREKCGQRVAAIDASTDDTEVKQRAKLEQETACQAELLRIQQKYDTTIELLLTGYDQFVAPPQHSHRSKSKHTHAHKQAGCCKS